MCVWHLKRVLNGSGKWPGVNHTTTYKGKMTKQIWMSLPPCWPTRKSVCAVADSRSTLAQGHRRAVDLHLLKALLSLDC